MGTIDYKIIDNFLSLEDFNNIKNILSSKDFPWFYNKDGVSYSNKFDGIYFSSILYKQQEDGVSFNISNYYYILIPLLKLIKPKSLLRVKANLYPRTERIFEHGKHIDYDFSHKSFLFYINTNNGVTILKNGTKINSVENRGLFFDSSELHQSTTCSDQEARININFNYF